MPTRSRKASTCAPHPGEGPQRREGRCSGHSASRVSFLSSLPSFLPSWCSCLGSFLPSLFLSLLVFVPWFLRSFLPSVLSWFLGFFLFSFLPSFFPAVPPPCFVCLYFARQVLLDAENVILIWWFPSLFPSQTLPFFGHASSGKFLFVRDEGFVIQKNLIRMMFCWYASRLQRSKRFCNKTPIPHSLSVQKRPNKLNLFSTTPWQKEAQHNSPYTAAPGAQRTTARGGSPTDLLPGLRKQRHWR